MDNSIGIIDIGSNSFHLVVGKYNNNAYFHIIDDAKVNVRLSEGMSATGKLSEDRMNVGEETLALFKNMCDTYALDKVIVVATAAVRKAENGQAFIDRIRKNIGLEIRLISGDTEATMDYLGVVNTIDIQNAVMMDIGGGSTELVLIRGREIVDEISIPFGSVDLTEEFNLSDKIEPEDLQGLNYYLKSAFEAVDFLRQAKGYPIVGVGGTIRNMGRIHRSLIDYPLEIAHNYRMTPDDVSDVCKTGAKLDLEGRRALKGLSKGRSDIFVGASHAVKSVMKVIDSSQLIISDAGLRDGLIFDHFGDGVGDLIPEVFENSLANTMMNYEVNAPHAYHVFQLSKKLFDELAPLHGITENVRKMVKAAAMLHDVGIKIQYSNHHEHSFYLILNAGLCGLTHRELLISAFMALNHRTNKKIQIEEMYLGMLDKKDKALIDQLSLFLQISEYLDRSMDGIVQDISCDIGQKEVILKVTSSVHSVFADMIISECGKKFKRVLDRTLKIENLVVN